MSATRFHRWALVALALLVTLGATSCATLQRRPRGVPIESRPTPPQPADTTVVVPRERGTKTTPTKRNGSTEPEGASSSTAPAPPTDPDTPPVESVMTPAERRAAMTRIVADTTSAGGAVRKCGTRKLLPDQESVWDTTKSLLAQTRSALQRDELWRAESLARKARQLAASLSCP